MYIPCRLGQRWGVLAATWKLYMVLYELYDVTGPDKWHKWYPMSNGAQQSPIALYSDAEHKTLQLKINGYKNATDLTACNVGHTGNHLLQQWLVLALAYNIM